MAIFAAYQPVTLTHPAALNIFVMAVIVKVCFKVAVLTKQPVRCFENSDSCLGAGLVAFRDLHRGFVSVARFAIYGLISYRP